MDACAHEVVEWQRRDGGMHVVGWLCRWCRDLRVVDYHHESGCRRDFCGAEPVAWEGVMEPLLSPSSHSCRECSPRSGSRVTLRR
jgi:hypothetical protein